MAEAPELDPESNVDTSPGQDGPSNSLSPETWASGGSSTAQLRFKVECFGQGKVHHDIVKKLGSPGDDPGIPCVLFVYKVSRETEDLRNALQWIEKKETTRKEICAVILLDQISEQSKNVGEETMNVPDLFDEETKVFRVLWKVPSRWKPSVSWSGWSSGFSCPEAIATAIATVKAIIRKRKSEVKCYGRGEVHEAILKKLHIPQCEGGPGIPCVLFVYKVSDEIEDLRQALRWITEKETTRKEDICAVFLLDQISEQSKKISEQSKEISEQSKNSGEETINVPDLFDKETKVFRVLWKVPSGWKLSVSWPDWRPGHPGFSCPEVIDTVKAIIRKRNSEGDS